MKRLVGMVLAVVMGIFCMGVNVFAETSTACKTPIGVESNNPYFAEGIYNSNNYSKNDLRSYSAGLINDYSIYLSNDGNRNITITGKTVASDIMESVGFTSISIKRWNGSTWEIEKSISDQLGSNKKLHTMNYSTTISGGYNYKLTVNHYAKASGLFGGSQSVFNETSYIWIA